MICARMDFTTLKGRLENVNNLVVVLHLGLATLLVIVKMENVPVMIIMLDNNVDPVQVDTIIIQVAMVAIVSCYLKQVYIICNINVIFIVEKNLLSTSDCSLNCGSKFEKYLHCQLRVINGQKIQVCNGEVTQDSIYCNNTECQRSSEVWTSWSNCSSDCLETLDEISTKFRKKDCQNPENSETHCLSETQLCDVPMCSPKGM